MIPEDLITADDVAKKLGVSRTTVMALYKKNPEFPAPYKISPRRILWSLKDIEIFFNNSRVCVNAE